MGALSRAQRTDDCSRAQPSHQNHTFCWSVCHSRKCSQLFGTCPRVRASAFIEARTAHALRSAGGQGKICPMTDSMTPGSSAA